MDAVLRPIDIAELGQLEPAVAEVYVAAFAGPPYDEGVAAAGRFLPRWRAQRWAAGWAGVGAWVGERLVGLAYGHQATPGLPWVDALMAQLTPAGKLKWGRGAFLLCELAVLPEHQGRGIGGALHDALMDEVKQPTALLTTLDDPATVGALLYRSRGWRQVSPSAYVVPGYPHRYVVMGLRLDRCG